MSIRFPEYAEKIREVARLLIQAERIWNLAHENPDGDAIGCALALHLGLKAMGREVTTFFPEQFPQAYAWLPGVDDVEFIDELPQTPPDLVLVNDVANFARLGERMHPYLNRVGVFDANAGAQRRGTVTLLNIDHHVSNEMFGDVNLVIPEAAATAEIVLELFHELKVKVSSDVAVNLYVALLTDTGRFCNPNTTQVSFETAGELVSLGVKPADVAQAIYSQHSLGEHRLLGRVLSQTVVDDRLGYYYSFISREMLDEYECRMADTESVIDTLRTMASPPVCFLFKEHANGLVKVSIRARNHFDANQFASRFGGGGHPGAAGFSFEGTLQAAIDAVENAMSGEIAHKQPEPESEEV